MAHKMMELLKNSDSRIKIFVIIGLIGIMLIVSSEMLPKHEKSDEQDSKNYSQYADELEKKTEKIISSIDGVGECNVMLTLASSNEYIYAQNSENKIDNSSNSQKNEYVLYDGANGDEPLLVKEYFPSVYGVVVVCSGGENVLVKERVINTVSSLYNIPTSRISVNKLKG